MGITLARCWALWPSAFIACELVVYAQDSRGMPVVYVADAEAMARPGDFNGMRLLLGAAMFSESVRGGTSQGGLE